MSFKKSICVLPLYIGFLEIFCLKDDICGLKKTLEDQVISKVSSISKILSV